MGGGTHERVNSENDIGYLGSITSPYMMLDIFSNKEIMSFVNCRF